MALADGTWQTVSSPVCAGFANAPPPIAPPSPPYGAMCPCETYSLTSSYVGTNSLLVNTADRGRCSRASVDCYTATLVYCHAAMHPINPNES